MHSNNKPSKRVASKAWREPSFASGNQQNRQPSSSQQTHPAWPQHTGANESKESRQNFSTSMEEQGRSNRDWQEVGKRRKPEINMQIGRPGEKEHVKRKAAKTHDTLMAQKKLVQLEKPKASRLLLLEAKKSKPDLFTSMYHCLSCGKSFKQVGALADHLLKHDGVNSSDYKVLQYQQQHAQHKTAPRASKTGFMFGDLLDAAVAKSSKKSSVEKSDRAPRIVVSTGADHRIAKPKEKVKKVEQGPERITREERAKLESAFEGLRLKSE